MTTTIAPIVQTITAIPTAGHRGVDSRDIFVTKQEAFQDTLTATTVTELNTLKDQVNTTTGQINTAVDTVVAKEALVSPHYTAIDAVNANEANINAVNANATNINAVNANTTNINAVNANATNINAVNANEANINAVASNEININNVSTNMSDINNLDTNMSDINAVASNEININNVSTNMTKITNLDTNMSNINNLDTNMSDINLVADAIQGGTLPTIIDDTTSSTSMTYSSSKIDSQINTAVGSIDLSGKQNTLVSGTNIKTINSTTILGSGDLALLTATNPSITGSITEQVYTLTGTEINPSNGTIQYKTVSSNTSFTVTLSAGQSVLLRLIGANGKTITFPTITWVGVTAPILTANCVIVLWKEQSTLYGAYVGTLV